MHACVGAGVSQVVVPVAFDQFMWAERMEHLGVAAPSVSARSLHRRPAGPGAHPPTTPLEVPGAPRAPGGVAGAPGEHAPSAGQAGDIACARLTASIRTALGPSARIAARTLQRSTREDTTSGLDQARGILEEHWEQCTAYAHANEV